MRRGLVIALLLADASRAEAQPLRPARPPETNAATQLADPQAPDPMPASTFSDWWPGSRTWLRANGVDVSASYVSESASNVAGGANIRARETGQLALGTTFDLEKLLGLRGGRIRATATYRRGDDLGAAAELGVLQQTQEVYGRGQTLRVTQLWYQQSLDGEHVDIKLGRLTMGEDIASFSCQFQNLSFCGSPPGNLAGDYWYNWPVSQWAARIRVKDARFYATAGIFEMNPRNLDNVFALGYVHGANGVNLPAEVGFTPRLGARGLPGAYKYGAWYNTQDASGRSGRYGFYFQLQQQLTGEAEGSPDGPRTTHGLVAFFNFTQTDKQTERTDNQIAAGIFYTGPFEARPNDDIGLALARTHVQTPHEGGEYANELFYSVHAFSWMILRPNVQLIAQPGGYSNQRAVVVLGLKAAVTL